MTKSGAESKLGERRWDDGECVGGWQMWRYEWGIPPLGKATKREGKCRMKFWGKRWKLMTKTKAKQVVKMKNKSGEVIFKTLYFASNLLKM